VSGEVGINFYNESGRAEPYKVVIYVGVFFGKLCMINNCFSPLTLIPLLSFFPVALLSMQILSSTENV